MLLRNLIQTLYHSEDIVSNPKSGRCRLDGLPPRPIRQLGSLHMPVSKLSNVGQSERLTTGEADRKSRRTAAPRKTSKSTHGKQDRYCIRPFSVSGCSSCRSWYRSSSFFPPLKGNLGESTQGHPLEDFNIRRVDLKERTLETDIYHSL